MATGIWSNGSSLWVVDANEYGDGNTTFTKVYVYDLDTVANGQVQRQNNKEFDSYGVYQSDAFGMWSDGNILWIAFEAWNGVVAHSHSSRTYLDAYDDTIHLGGYLTPYGIWSNGETMWVVDTFDLELFAYQSAPGYSPSNRRFNQNISLDYTNSSPTGMTSDGATIWVANSASQNSSASIFAYDFTSNRLNDKQFVLALGNNDPTGMTSDISTIWVADQASNKIFAYATGKGSLVQIPPTE